MTCLVKRGGHSTTTPVEWDSWAVHARGQTGRKYGERKGRKQWLAEAGVILGQASQVH